MRAVLLLADAASQHPDHTFSLLRAGITEVRIPKGQPMIFHGGIVARVSATPAEAGRHTCKIRLSLPDGSIGAELGGDSEIPQHPVEGHSIIVASVALMLPMYGVYTFRLLVDDKVYDEYAFSVVEP